MVKRYLRRVNKLLPGFQLTGLPETGRFFLDASLAFLILCLYASSIPVFGFTQRLQVEQVGPLSSQKEPFSLVESFLAVNPTDPNNLLASAMSTTAERSIIYASWDGGTTWRLVPSPQGKVFPGGDPMLIFDGNGRAYFATIQPGFSVWFSKDKGKTWSGPVGAGEDGRYDDREWVAASPKADSGQIPVYGVAKTIKSIEGRRQNVIITTRSLDEGKSFKDPQILPIENGYLQFVSYFIVRQNGTILMPYVVNYERLENGRYRGKIWLRTSSDQGNTWSGPHFVSDYFSSGDKSGDQRWKGLGITKMATDESDGKFNGTIYMTWAALVDDYLQIVMVHSVDGGQTWSDPVRVNDGGFSSNHSTPMVAVNKDGVVAVTWNDRRNDSKDNCFQHFVAVSRDGGQTFSTNRRISEKQTCPGSGSRWLNGGETQGLVALPDSSFRATWSVGKKGSLSLWTAVVRVKY